MTGAHGVTRGHGAKSTTESQRHREIDLEKPCLCVPVSLWFYLSVGSRRSVPLHCFRERISQPIEQPVAGEKHRERGRSEGEQPFPVAHRAKEENLLIRNGQM